MAMFGTQQKNDRKISGTVDSYIGRRYTVIDDSRHRHFAESSVFYPPGARVIIVGEVIVDRAAEAVEPVIYEV